LPVSLLQHFSLIQDERKIVVNKSFRSDDKKYYKWKSTSTCACVAVDLKAVSIFTDHEPLQNVIAFSDGNCQKVLGPISAKRCLGTLDTFMDGAIESVMFWLPGVCDLKEALGDIVKDVEHVLELGATIG
jgi:hypothetical protein